MIVSVLTTETVWTSAACAQPRPSVCNPLRMTGIVLGRTFHGFMHPQRMQYAHGDVCCSQTTSQGCTARHAIVQAGPPHQNRLPIITHNRKLRQLLLRTSIVQKAGAKCRAHTLFIFWQPTAATKKYSVHAHKRLAGRRSAQRMQTPSDCCKCLPSSNQVCWCNPVRPLRLLQFECKIKCCWHAPVCNTLPAFLPAEGTQTAVRAWCGTVHRLSCIRQSQPVACHLRSSRQQAGKEEVLLAVYLCQHMPTAKGSCALLVAESHRSPDFLGWCHRWCQTPRLARQPAAPQPHVCRRIVRCFYMDHAPGLTLASLQPLALGLVGSTSPLPQMAPNALPPLKGSLLKLLLRM